MAIVHVWEEGHLSVSDESWKEDVAYTRMHCKSDVA